MSKKADSGQVYGIPTLDSAFKWVLSDDSIRASFFHTFIPHVHITSSERLNEYLHPLQKHQLLRNWLNKPASKNQAAFLHEKLDQIKVFIGDKKTKHHDKKATQFFEQFLRHYTEVTKVFPKEKYNGTIDFVCKLDTGEYALIEMQVMPTDNFDNRALAHAALLYGNQLEKGSNWGQIKRIIGINILGGGFGDQMHWADTPNDYIRHYKFQDQVNKDNPHFITGMEIIQYALNNVPEKLPSQAEQNWFLFLKNAHNMKEEEVRKEIKTPEVLHAFDMMKLKKMPANVLKGYQKDKAQYECFSEYIAGQATLIKAQAAEATKLAVAEATKKVTAAAIKKVEAATKQATAAAAKKIEAATKQAAVAVKEAEDATKKAAAAAKKKMREQEIQKSHEVARILCSKGMSLSDIRDVTGLSLKELRSIQKNG
ncbi:MAG: PD-(D/E)XK nuclease family transposase [Chlamydiota bacterium]